MASNKPLATPSHVEHRSLTLFTLEAIFATMVTINCANTQPVNPPGVSPIITREQLWKASERKVRYAHEFVPVFSDCKVLEDHGETVVRETTLKPMEGRPGKTQQETCKLFPPTKVGNAKFSSWNIAKYN